MSYTFVSKLLQRSLITVVVEEIKLLLITKGEIEAISTLFFPDESKTLISPMIEEGLIVFKVLNY